MFLLLKYLLEKVEEFTPFAVLGTFACWFIETSHIHFATITRKARVKFVK